MKMRGVLLLRLRLRFLGNIIVKNYKYIMFDSIQGGSNGHYRIYPLRYWWPVCRKGA